MAERRPPSSRSGGERRQPASRDRGEYRQPVPQSRDGYRQASSPSRSGERPPAPRDRGEYRQAPPRDRGEYRQAPPQSRDSYRQPSAPDRGGDRSRRQSPSRRNDVIRCENCGEDYSVTYKRCPFCDERPIRGGVSGKRVANTRGGGYGRPASALQAAIWVGSFLVVCVAMFIIYRFIGAPLFGGQKDPDSSKSSNPGTSVTDPSGSGADSSSGNVPAPAVQSIALSKIELTLESGGSEQLTANLLPAGVTGDVTWASSDETVATVDAAGLVTNVNAGASDTHVIISASCGDVTAQADVYCKTSNNTSKRGKIVNAEKGVNIRSGPGTDYDIVASASNGSRVTVQGEENGWYKVTYNSTKSGYIRKDFISLD
ncbi:MAG: SH3 domain-containing protein [Lawsonibacter sp.]|jgi:uncharacterized protein YjdB|nr:SH3 domain-containing protein [Lawsonibacter sp.]